MLFEEIIRCARSGDAACLHNTIALDDTKKGIDVESEDFPYLTPAGELARMGEFSAAKFLEDQGACVYSIASGLGYGGHVAEADAYIKIYDKTATSVAKGCAAAGNFSNADRFIINNKASVNDVAYLCAARGYAGQAARYFRDFNACPRWIAEGFAQVKDEKNRDKYISIIKKQIQSERDREACQSAGKPYLPSNSVGRSTEGGASRKEPAYSPTPK